ncbi:MAG: glycosyltransferase family 2 protein [Candidatus Portnoybacteria bacterium]|nr:glycosyltransferase family 2 protein [Candidatus Portnoybacteria bacterium]
MPKIIIIVLNWNGLSDTIECIESLKKIDYQNYEIILVDNGSMDNSVAVLKEKFGDIYLIENRKNLGFAGGNNVGIKYALKNGADFILLLNNDTKVESDFLTKLVKIANNDNKIGIVGPIIFSYDEPEKIYFAGGKVNWSRTRGEHINFEKKSISVIPAKAGIQTWMPDQVRHDIYGVDYITGCCLLIKKEVVEKIGLMSEDYFLYYEDTDWCLRAQRAGYKCVLASQAKIYHKQSKSTGEFSYPYIYYHSRNGLMLCSRFRSKILAHIISSWIFLKQIIKLVIGYKREWAKPVMKGVVDFWKGKAGKLEGYY